jgi:hypothetical protein
MAPNKLAGKSTEVEGNNPAGTAEPGGVMNGSRGWLA